MKHLLKAIIATTSLIGMGSANAQPPPPYPTTFSGQASVQKGSGPVLLCNISITITDGPPPAGTLYKGNASISPGDPLCATINLLTGPYWITGNPAGHGTFTVHGVYADTTITPGDCVGDITAVWDPSLGEWDIQATMAEGVIGTGACSVNGYLLP